ncbi:uncharacterized protein FRV6_16487 [Fusarium oxysporum]|uniref:Uncharacterized protein n=1 Tax=Fusarium oxysporum TaxID=5507 RepID=A0A2H3UEV4_FUSOX|nr:uncharacterized protein FRV6_16487 [Fusarium oxysporum]
MKRSRDSMDDQKGSHAQKKVKTDTSIPVEHLSENDIGAGSADFTTNMYSSRNNKRNIDEMNGQPEPESDRPAKRMDHDHVMRDEVIMHSPRNNKRNIGEMRGQVEPDSDRPAKRRDHSYGSMSAANDDHIMRDEAVMHSSRNNKRILEEMIGQLEPESDRPAKRLDHGHGSMSADSHDYVMRDEAQPNQGLGDIIHAIGGGQGQFTFVKQMSTFRCVDDLV